MSFAPLGVDFGSMGVDLGFGNQDRPQEVDDGHLVIDFRPLGVNFGLYRILQMICLENLIIGSISFCLTVCPK